MSLPPRAPGVGSSGLRVCMLLHKPVVEDARVRREASALSADGHPVTVLELAADAHGTLDGFSRASASPPPWVRRRLPPPLYRLVSLAAFVRRAAALRPDVVHAHDAAMLLPGLLAARLTRARLVYDSHELATGVPYRDGAWARFVAAVERLGVRRADLVITVSDGIADRLRARYRLSRRPVVVRNACALPAAPPDGSLRHRLGIRDAPMVLHQGAAAEGRGCELLVAAMAAVPGAHVVFLGGAEPQVREAIERAAADPAVTGRVHLVPAVPLPVLLARTAEADVGATLLQDTCENHRLALPNKLFEYLAAGVPVVASDLPELGWVVREHGVGWTVTPGDQEALAAALREAVGAARDPALAGRVAAAAERFAWRHERGRLLAAYAELRDSQVSAGTPRRRRTLWLRRSSSSGSTASR